MNEGLIKRYKAQLEKLKQFLKENEGSLTEDQINEVLERISYIMEMIELLE